MRALLPLLLASPALATGDDWSSLDEEIEALQEREEMSSSLRLGGFFQSGFHTSSDRRPSGQRTSDFGVRAARLSLEGERGDYTFRVEQDFTTGTGLLDAWLSFPVSSVEVKVGRARIPVATSATQHLGDMFFLDRTHIGRLLETQAEGVQAEGDAGRVHWQAAVQDGSDAAGDSYLVSVRGPIPLGTPEFVDQAEGAWDACETTTADLAVAFYDDDGVDDATGLLLEARAQGVCWSAGAEVLDLGKGLPTGNGSRFRVVSGIAHAELTGDAAPWAIHGTWQPAPERIELGARLQMYENNDDERQIDLAATHYFDGPALRWTFQLTTVDSDRFGEATMGLLGVTLSF